MVIHRVSLQGVEAESSAQMDETISHSVLEQRMRSVRELLEDAALKPARAIPLQSNPRS